MSGNVQSQMIPRQTGRVKWFNTSSGFGFITVCTDTETLVESESKDIFVHFSSISAKDSAQYKYLVQGEYVDFELAKPAKGTHEFHAVNVTGVKGGELMCETIRPNVQPFVRRVTQPFITDENDGFIPVAHRHRIKQPVDKRQQPSDKRQQSVDKRQQPVDKRQSPSSIKSEKA